MLEQRESFPGEKFLRPTYAEWVQEYQTVPWDTEQYSSRIHPTVIYSYLYPMRQALALPSMRDYNRPERTALVLETLHLLPAEARHGGIALATWMVKAGQDHLPTKATGASITASALILSDYLNLPSEAAEYIRATLREQGITALQGYTESADLIRRKIAEVGEEAPLQIWFLGKALAAESVNLVDR